MITFMNENYCEFCFERIVNKKQVCPACGSVYNQTAYHGILPIGSVLAGRYAVGKVLGKGGFGVTYLCFDIRDRKRVAIKEYLPDSLSHRNSGESTVSTYSGEKGEQFRVGAQKFFEEAKLVSRFNGNPNIISVHEFFYENNTTYFVMEYLSGTDLKGYLRKHPKMSEAEVMYIAKRAIDALLIVHSTNTIHRDIAPDNIFVCNDGNIKLIDFGAARHVIANESKSLSVILKHGFAPLEQYQTKGKQGPWTDIYALGVSLYFALKDKMPDDAMSRLEDSNLDMNGISDGFARILTKMMAPMIGDRYTDVFSLKRDLDSLGIDPIVPRFLVNSGKTYSFCIKCGRPKTGSGKYCEICAPKSIQTSVLTPVPEAVKNKNETPAHTSTPVAKPSLEPIMPVREEIHYCSDCGKEVVGNSKLCADCANREYASPVEEQAPEYIPAPAPTYVQATKQKKKKPIWLFILLGCVGVTMLFGILIAGLGLGHTHTYSDSNSYVSVEPTYYSTGVRIRYCDTCGEYTTQVIPKLVADFDEAYDAYENGDYYKAVEIYSILAEQGDDAAQNNLGLCYEYGHGVEQNYYTAVYWYTKAAEQGSAVAQNNLGICYYYGEGVTQNYYTAVYWFTESAEQDYANGQNWLGNCYYHGRGVTQNYYTAVTWYTKAAEQGEQYAQYNLGWCYYYGQGTTQNKTKGIEYIKKAAAQGHEDAIEWLDENYY